MIFALRLLSNSIIRCRPAFAYHQKLSLVNVKLKWVKDKILDAAVAGETDLIIAFSIKNLIAAAPFQYLPIHRLSKHRHQFGLADIRVSSFMRRYPSIFAEFNRVNPTLPCFRLTDQASDLHSQELQARENTRAELVERLRKLLMLTAERILPIQTIDQLKWDLGLPHDYLETLIPCYPQFFQFVTLPDERIGLRLSVWDETLAVSELQKKTPKESASNCLGFPLKFTRGFGLKSKSMAWLKEWQKLPYTSPYVSPCDLDPRTDVSEKRIVGVFHELLHLTVSKRTERKNFSNLRKPLKLPQKFTKVFGRHPGIFYISEKCATQTIVLREAYDGCKLIQQHPIVLIREKFADMMRQGRLDKSRGLFKKIEVTNDITKHEGNVASDDYDEELARSLGISSSDDFCRGDLKEYESNSNVSLLSNYDDT